MTGHLHTSQPPRVEPRKFERDFLHAKMPTLPEEVARVLFDAGRWVHEQAGAFLTLEGEEVGRLIYLHSGSADIQLQGTNIARCQAGNFIGEMTCMSGGPATASAVLREDAVYFVIEATALRKLCFANPDLRRHIEHALHLDTQQKLQAANSVLLEQNLRRTN